MFAVFGTDSSQVKVNCREVSVRTDKTNPPPSCRVETGLCQGCACVIGTDCNEVASSPMTNPSFISALIPHTSRRVGVARIPTLRQALDSVAANRRNLLLFDQGEARLPQPRPQSDESVLYPCPFPARSIWD